MALSPLHRIPRRLSTQREIGISPSGRLRIKEPPPDEAADTPKKPWLFWECLKWKKVMDDFFHGQPAGPHSDGRGQAMLSPEGHYPAEA
jgi:hypothetical protein